MIPLTEAEQTSLQHLRNSGTTQQRLAQRAIILLTGPRAARCNNRQAFKCNPQDRPKVA